MGMMRPTASAVHAVPSIFGIHVGQVSQLIPHSDKACIPAYRLHNRATQLS